MHLVPGSLVLDHAASPAGDTPRAYWPCLGVKGPRLGRARGCPSHRTEECPEDTAAPRKQGDGGLDLSCPNAEAGAATAATSGLSFGFVVAAEAEGEGTGAVNSRTGGCASARRYYPARASPRCFFPRLGMLERRGWKPLPGRNSTRRRRGTSKRRSHQTTRRRGRLGRHFCSQGGLMCGRRPRPPPPPPPPRQTKPGPRQPTPVPRGAAYPRQRRAGGRGARARSARGHWWRHCVGC
jgi:hypothetical protein